MKINKTQNDEIEEIRRSVYDFKKALKTTMFYRFILWTVKNLSKTLSATGSNSNTNLKSN